MNNTITTGSLIFINGWTVFGSFVRYIDDSYIDNIDNWKSIDLHTRPRNDVACIYIGPETKLEKWHDFLYIDDLFYRQHKTYVALFNGNKIDVRGALFSIQQ
jgi:hypothetical protein